MQVLQQGHNHAEQQFFQQHQNVQIHPELVPIGFHQLQRRGVTFVLLASVHGKSPLYPENRRGHKALYGAERLTRGRQKVQQLEKSLETKSKEVFHWLLREKIPAILSGQSIAIDDLFDIPIFNIPGNNRLPKIK